jgi:hypothetical protein
VQNVVEQLTAAGDDRVLDVADMPNYASATSAPHLAARGSDRRRQDADALFDSLANGTADFWQDVHDSFMDRDLTREDVRHLITRGLSVADGSYREMLEVFRLPGTDYKRLLNFLVRHGCAVDFRPFRPGQASRPDAAHRAHDTPGPPKLAGSIPPKFFA